MWRAAGPRRPESGQRPSRRGRKGLATEPGPLAHRDSAPRPGAAPRLAGRRSPHTGCHSASERPGARPPRPQVRNLNRNQPSGSRVSHHALPCSSEAPRGRLSVSAPAPPRGRVCATRGVSRHERHMAFLGRPRQGRCGAVPRLRQLPSVGCGSGSAQARAPRLEGSAQSSVFKLLPDTQAVNFISDVFTILRFWKFQGDSIMSFEVGFGV